MICHCMLMYNSASSACKVSLVIQKLFQMKSCCETLIDMTNVAHSGHTAIVTTCIPHHWSKCGCPGVNKDHGYLARQQEINLPNPTLTIFSGFYSVI